MNEINIDHASCIKCNKCVQICPTEIFKQSNKQADVELVDIMSCIVCGHCVSVCPTNSITHSAFPSEKIHEIDYSSMPTPEQVLQLCQTRRSNRAFSQKEIPENSLALILQAAHLAPTASNLQRVEYTLVTDPEKLKLITRFTLDTFASVAKKLETPVLKQILKYFIPNVYKMIPKFYRLIEEEQKGNDLILRNAKAVLLIHTPKKDRFGCQDANLAYQNGSLMAESLGVSQFYTGFVCAAINQDKKDTLAKKLGINGEIQAGMALGMPSFKFPRFADRKDIVVKRI